MQRVRTLILSRWFWLIAVLVFSISRLTTFLFPFDSDQWIFSYVGRKWLDGATLYVDMWDHKSPLIYLYNGVIYTVFGDNIWLQRAFFTLVAIFVVWLFYKTALLLYETAKIKNWLFITRITTLLFVFFANLSVFANSGNNNENIGLIFLLATVYLYLLYRKNNERQLILLASGVFAGFVFVLKANFTILLLPLLIDLMILHRKDLYRLVSSLAFFAFGTLLQLLAWALYFKSIGTFKQFYIAAFEFNSKYIKALGWDLKSPGVKIFVGIVLLLVIFFLPFLIKAIRGFWHPNKSIGFIIPLLAVSTLVFMVAAGTFYSHYFLITIPYLCLIFGATANQVFKNNFKLKVILPSSIAIALLLISVKLGIYNSFYGSASTELKNQKLAAKYIDEHTSQKDKIFANLYGATFYQLAKRDSGSRYISASHPLIDYKYALGYDFNRNFIFDMEDSEAKYVVMNGNLNDIYRVQNPVLMRYFNNNYHLEKTVSGYDIYRRDSI